MAPRPQSIGPKQQQGLPLPQTTADPIIGSRHDTREEPAPTSTSKGPARTECEMEHRTIDHRTSCNGNGESQADKSDMTTQPNNTDDANQAHHVHFSPRPTIRRFPSQTKAWTDHAAPEPIGTPHKTPQRKLGYGDLFAKSGGGAALHGGVEGRMTYPHSYHGGKAGDSGFVLRRSGSGHMQLAQPTSVTRRDFPSLSPHKSRLASTTRMKSWSSVVGGSERTILQNNNDVRTNTTVPSALDFIPPPPLIGNASQFASKDDANEHLVPMAHSYPPPMTNHSHDVPLHLAGSTPHRPRRPAALLSPSHHAPNHHFHDYSPFDAFTTMSRSSLQNDIGTLLARYNRVDEAMERYQQSIEVATTDRDGLKAALEKLFSSESNTPSQTGTMTWTTPRRTTKCPKVTEAEGLAWFRQKLLKGDVAAVIPTSPPASSKHEDSSISSNNHHHSPLQFSPTPFQPAGFGGLALHTPKQRIRSASFSVTTLPCLGLTRSLEDGPHIHQRTPIRASGQTLLPSCSVADPHPSEQLTESHEYKRSYSQSNSLLPHQTSWKPTATIDDTRTTPKPIAPLDDIEIYSCNGLTPLGLEYICDPLPVLGSALRTLVTTCLAQDDPSDFGVIADICESSVDTRRKRMIAAFLIDSAALIASRINLATLRYRRADDLEDILCILRQALNDIDSMKSIIVQTVECDWLRDCNLSDVFGLLEIVGRLNVGTVLFRMNQVRDAMSSFESAKRKLEEMRDFDANVHRKNVESNIDPPTINNEHHPHDDNRSPSNEYLLLVVRSSLSRISLRLNDPDSAEKICKVVSEESKPYKRNSSRLLRANSHGFGGGFARSDSFSGTTSAVHCGAIAYQHNLDRRQKWLSSVAEYYLIGLVHEARGEPEDYKSAVSYYNHLLSLARVKLDHRHPYICALLERRGAVLFEQRKLQCSMLSYLACLKILEHQQVTKSIAFHEADLARVLYAVARVLHDKEEYHDALHMYQRALVYQRGLADGRPSLAIITTLCNISRVHHLSGEIDEALATNKEVLKLATMLVGGKMDHPFLIHRLKVEGNILIEAGRLEDAMNTFIDAARRCCEDGRNRMITTMMGSSGAGGNTAQEDADAGDSSVLSIRSAASLAHISFLHPAAAAG
ncbi:hypothetical protein HJC23_007874 [Cyclotella cryptica]|uniref:Uncharacterized protein n=1 Tax=Cyclotella cryptica TaxID=29204 RepID=A0ABD3R0M1_9STRA|eukprot:CCRYP_000206-RA/>CCRYP_000206-RA protein AED:0.03 eAED:-0.03 QI:0/-1/0/1/-1/1/1/0/1128